MSETLEPEADPEPAEDQPEYAVNEEDDGRLLVVLSLPRLDDASTVELTHSSSECATA